MTPLHRAAELGDAAMVKLLLDRGADATIKTAGGSTALDIAESRLWIDATRVLGGHLD